MTDPVRQLMVPPEAAPTVESLDEPDVVALMVQALDASWMALAFAHFADEHEMRVTDEVLAQHILENIAAGERRLSVLSGNALGVLEPRAAKRPDGHAQGPLWRDPGDRVDVIEVVRRAPARRHPS